MEEAEQGLLSAFKKSQKTKHKGSKGNARAKSIADFLTARLPAAYGIVTMGEVVDYLDQRSGEIDILIFDRQRNALLSENPLWLAAESLLAYIEVKSILTEEELTKSYIGAKQVNALRPFKKTFTLAGQPEAAALELDQLRCFRTIFSFGTNLTDNNWLEKEWERVKKSASAAACAPASIDRILVVNRGMITPPYETGTDQFEVSSVFQQWFINLVNFLARENGRRSAIDWQLYTKKTMPGWRSLRNGSIEKTQPRVRRSKAVVSSESEIR